jgi:tetratricopeptide (TPR) repeat protein
VHYSNLGAHKDALEVALRAVHLYENLVKVNTTIYETRLASSLSNIANVYSNIGEYSSALRNAQRSVAIYEKWHTLIPSVYERNYTIAKNVLKEIEAKAKG